jgi:hypothetical protein
MVSVATDKKKSGLTQLASCSSAAQHCVGADGTEVIGQSYLPPHNFTILNPSSTAFLLSLQ